MQEKHIKRNPQFPHEWGLGGWSVEDTFLLLGQGPVSIEEFFVDPKNGTLETNKPPAMQVSQDCFSLQ